jgi:hypothetical protein
MDLAPVGDSSANGGASTGNTTVSNPICILQKISKLKSLYSVENNLPLQAK